MSTNKFLLPGSFRFTGIFFFIIALFLGIIRFHFGIKPDILDMKPFALYSSYLEDKYLQFIGNNMSEEIICLFGLIGLFFIAFSRDKMEYEEKSLIRTKALYITVYIQVAELIASIILTYGFAFVYTLIANIFIPFIIYILTFRILLLQRKRIDKENQKVHIVDKK